MVCVAAIGVSILAACTSSGGRQGAAPAQTIRPAAQARPVTPNGPRITITPADGKTRADPAAGIAVTVTGGNLTNVAVSSAGDPVSGTFNSTKTTWHSRWALNVSQRYTVSAAAVGGGMTAHRTSSFRTLTPAQTFTTQIIEGAGQTYGVGIPVILYFSQRITDRAAVERALQLTTSKPVVGAWYWDDSCGMAPTCAYFRPREYWPPHITVTFTGHLNGVEGAPGVYGYHTLTQSFIIGSSLIVVASTRTHHLDLYRDGRLIDRWAISTGRPGDDTPNGTYLTLDKGNPVDMVGPGYNIEVPWSVRITWSGDYLHDAYWSVGEQGFTNVSHGCVNMPPAAAETYYKMEVPGDPVTITGSPRGGRFDNGWTQWFMSWDRYLSGSALHMAVSAGPDGSTFVTPSSLAPGTATAPLGTSAPGNSSSSLRAPGYFSKGVPTPPVHGLPYSGEYVWFTRNLFTNCCSRGSVGEVTRSWNPQDEITIGDVSPGNGLRSMYLEPAEPAKSMTVCRMAKFRNVVTSPAGSPGWYVIQMAPCSRLWTARSLGTGWE
jgi:lipoprotein-anchoring transpeptidase ErfK/SrfK